MHFTLPSDLAKRYVVIGTIFAVFCTISFYSFPVLKFAFTKERYFLELLTMLLSISAIVTTYKLSHFLSEKLLRFQLWFIGIASFVFLMEETGFGRSILFHYVRPKVLGTPIDSVHDFLLVLITIVKGYPGTTLFIGTMFGIVIASAIALFFGYKNIALLKRFSQTQTFQFFCGTLFFLFCAGMLDSELFGDYAISIRYFEELCEFLAAYALWSAARILWHTHIATTHSLKT